MLGICKVLQKMWVLQLLQKDMHKQHRLALKEIGREMHIAVHEMFQGSAESEV